jgi:5-enolpyruvylshikimate-3-phosphate synthase
VSVTQPCAVRVCQAESTSYPYTSVYAAFGCTLLHVAVLHSQVEEGRDYCIITPPAQLKSGVAIDTYDDHRMAMAFSLAACGDVAVTINDPGCTRKTFPTYFQVFEGVVEHK